jgi:hypothetical protein
MRDWPICLCIIYRNAKSTWVFEEEPVIGVLCVVNKKGLMKETKDQVNVMKPGVVNERLMKE